MWTSWHIFREGFKKVNFVSLIMKMKPSAFTSECGCQTPLRPVFFPPSSGRKCVCSSVHASVFLIVTSLSANITVSFLFNNGIWFTCSQWISVLKKYTSHFHRKVGLWTLNLNLTPCTLNQCPWRWAGYGHICRESRWKFISMSLL